MTLSCAVLVGTLLYRALRAACRIDCDPLRGWLPLATTPTPWLGLVVIAADITENVAIFGIVEVLSAGGAAQGWMLDTATTASVAKWLLIALALVQIGHTMLGSECGRAGIVRAMRALSAQRYSLFAFVPIAALGLLPGNGILDQVPDVARAWFGQERNDVLGALTAAALLAAVSVGLIVLGRLISDSVYRLAVTAAIGVVATVLLALALMALLVGSTVVVHLHYAPPRIFWWGPLKLREAPVATLLLLTVAGILVLGSDQSVHGIRGLRPSPAVGAASAPVFVQQRGVEQLFTEWDAATRDCVGVTTAGDNPRTIRPMIMVAAEGGGIRAAFWTAAALDEIKAATDPVTRCGLDSVIMASGVSGGAVGLAVSRFIETPSTSSSGRSAADAVWDLGSPDALALGTVGLLVRDPIYSVTGLALGSDVQGGSGDGWVDRAGLMETSWEAQVPELAGDFFDPPSRLDGRGAGFW